MDMKNVSREYLESIIEVMESYLSEEICQEIKRMAIPKSGGKMKSKNQKVIYSSGKDLKDLYDWAKDRYPIYIKPKFDGIKSVVRKNGNEIILSFDGQEENKIEIYPELKSSFQNVNGDFLVSGKIISCDQPIFMLSDLMSWDKDMSQECFRERRIGLEEFYREEVGEMSNIILSPLKMTNNRVESGINIRWAINFDLSNGFVAIDNEELMIVEKKNVSEKELMKYIPSHGSDNVKIAFIGASGNEIDGIRGEPLTGDCGYIFNKLFLNPLGLKRKDVFISNIVPMVLKDENGKIREPREKEIKEWEGWIIKELDEYHPKIVIALGRTAKEILKNRVDFYMPHPRAIKKYGSSGEIERKIKAVKKAINMDGMNSILLMDEIIKQSPDGKTSGEVAEEFWKDNWYKMYPVDGKGEFVYQHHWRGLSEENVNYSENNLFQTDHSLHGDLRFQKDNGLWGFTVFLGRTNENKNEDKLIRLEDGEKLRGTFKPENPMGWLKVGDKEDYVIEPKNSEGGWQKIIQEDKGTYEIGVWKENMIEVFLNGGKLKGRFIFENVPMNGERVWLIDKPKDQTPYAEKNRLDDVIRESKEKGQEWIVWGKPNQRPEKINVQSGKIVKEFYADIIKADDELKIVTGIVLEPDSVDAHGDVISKREIEKAAHYFMENSRTIGDSHRKKAPADLIECYITMDETIINGQKVKKGTWVISVKILDDDLWKKVKDGYYTGFSVGGFGIREVV